MTGTIVIGNTNITINNLSKANDNLLRRFKNKLSVWADAPNGGKYISWKAYIENKEEDCLYIHKGIPMDKLYYYFPNHNIEYDNTPSAFKKINLTLMINPRDQLQKDTVATLNDNTESQIFICLKPGSGKTYCTINYICKKKLTPIIVVDSINIINQWKESFLKFTDIDEKEIFIISGQESIRQLIAKINKLKPKVFLAMHRTLQAYCSEDWEVANELFSKLGIGIKVFDEAHVEWKNIFYIDLFTNIKYTIYLTATPDRSNPREKDVYLMMFDDIFMYGYEESRDKKYIKYIDYQWNSKPSLKALTSMKGNYGFDSNEYNDYLLNEKFDEFTILLEEIINLFREKYKDKKIAIVVNCNNLISALVPIFSILYDGNDIGIFCGLTPKKVRYLEKEKSLILTTIKGFNKAVDVKNLAVVINTVNVSSSVIMEQLSGRLRYSDKHPSYFVQLTDMGFPSFRYNEKERNKIMQNIAKSVTVFE